SSVGRPARAELTTEPSSPAGFNGQRQRGMQIAAERFELDPSLGGLGDAQLDGSTEGLDVDRLVVRPGGGANLDRPTEAFRADRTVHFVEPDAGRKGLYLVSAVDPADVERGAEERQIEVG